MNPARETTVKPGRRKGFGVSLPREKWRLVLTGYDVACQRGENTPEMDQAVVLIPNVRLTGDYIRFMMYRGPDVQNNEADGTPAFNDRTIRFRAADIEGAYQLLAYTALVCPFGQAPSVLWNRARALLDISELDLLADAGR